jgi:hypothetical protein
MLCLLEARQSFSQTHAKAEQSRSTNSMNNTFPKSIPVFALGAFALALAPSIQAVPTLNVVIDNVLVQSVTDGGAGDTAAAIPGLINYSGSFGGWTFVTSLASTKPNNGSAANAEMHLNFSADSNLPAPSTLQFFFSETDFGPVNASFTVNRSSTVDGGTGNLGESSTQSAWADVGNALFAQTTLLGTSTFGPGANSANSSSGNITDPNVYSLTTLVSITHNAGPGAGNARHSSGQIQVIQNAPDGGLTLTLLGGVMLGLAVIRRRLFQA